MTFDYGARLAALRLLMESKSIDALLASVGADLPYLTGYEAMPLERLTMLVLTMDRQPVLLVPELEAPRVVERQDVFAIRAWSETEDPVGIAAGLLDGAGSVAGRRSDLGNVCAGTAGASPARSFRRCFPPHPRIAHEKGPRRNSTP